MADNAVRSRCRTDVLRVVSTAGPLYVSMVAASLSALVNVAVLGRTSTADLAAFALTGAVFFPATAAVSGAVRGVMPFVSSVAGDPAGLRRVIADGTWLAVVIGVLGGLAVTAVPALGEVAGVPTQTLSQLGSYPLLMAAAVVLTALGSMASSSLVGMGRSPVVMRAGLLGALCTMLLSPLLVLGIGPLPALGLTGSGVALLVANVATLAVNLVWLRRHVAFSLAISLRDGPCWSRILELARVGIPMAGTVLVKFTVLGIVALAAARVSTTAAASHGIATTLVGLTFTAAVAVGQAGIPLVSERAVTSDVPGVRRAVTAGLLVAGTVVAVLCSALFSFRNDVAALFSSDQDVRALLTLLLPVVALAIAADSLQAVIGFGLAGLRQTMPSFVIFCASYGLLALLAVPVAETFGVVALWTVIAGVNASLIIGQAAVFWHITAVLRQPLRSPV